MLGNADFSAFDPREPQRLPQPSIDYVRADVNENAPGTSQIYAAAWTLAQRDHELDKLFNADFYQGQ